MKRIVRRGSAAIAVIAAIAMLCGCGPAMDFTRSFPLPDNDFSDFSEQRPKWEVCGVEVLCADVFAPLDWDDPDGERITLRLTKHPAEGEARLGSLLLNPGGPGASGANFVRQNFVGIVNDSVRERYDLIGWDPRGVGQSSAVTCLDDEGLDEFFFGTGDPEEDGALLEFGSDAWIEQGLETSAEFAEACAEGSGDLLGHIDTASTVRDLDMIRQIVGDDKLNYLGFSYGTQIGALYADAYPERVGRLVLDGAVDPSSTLEEVSREQVVGIEGALRNYTADCLTRESCPLSGEGAGDADVDRAMTRIGELLARVEADPIPAADGRMLYDSTMFTSIASALYSPSMWPQLDVLFEEVAEGGAEQAFRLADAYYDRDHGVYRTNLFEAFISINCVDYDRPDQLDYDVMRADAAKTIELAPVTGKYQTFGDIGCAHWPAPAADVIQEVEAAGADPILVIGTTGDPATPFRWAQQLDAQLESSVLVTFEGEGHTAYGESGCVDAIVDDYLLSGAVPESQDAVCAE
ncbi:alpha/beta fold hydrolase [Leucobacter weissii]|uniref:Alpha/beta fold hydrolase n=1 Tax=Leucobacter weissii TaxID=1983706 RepID=A0A939SB93_9MICO|nr:alpha/beta hydrolase [Leucobacter weissii]MBO1901240.1 alpha/beta fold hydrolase [Leucobacter weissii]